MELFIILAPLYEIYKILNQKPNLNIIIKRKAIKQACKWSYTQPLWGAHLNISRATEMYLTFLELADIGRQDVVYQINLSLSILRQSRETSATCIGCCMQWKKVKV